MVPPINSWETLVAQQQSFQTGANVAQGIGAVDSMVSGILRTVAQGVGLSSQAKLESIHYATGQIQRDSQQTMQIATLKSQAAAMEKSPGLYAEGLTAKENRGRTEAQTGTYLAQIGSQQASALAATPDLTALNSAIARSEYFLGKPARV